MFAILITTGDVDRAARRAAALGFIDTASYLGMSRNVAIKIRELYSRVRLGGENVSPKLEDLIELAKEAGLSEREIRVILSR